MTEPIQIYVEDVQYTCNPKQQWQSPTVILQKSSNSYFTQIFQQLFYTNIPTVLSVVDSQLFWFT